MYNDFINSVKYYLGLYSYDTYIDIEFVEDLDAFGYCYGDEDMVYVEIKDNMSASDTMITIVHELTHALQLAQGREMEEDEAYGNEDVVMKKIRDDYYNSIMEYFDGVIDEN